MFQESRTLNSTVTGAVAAAAGMTVQASSVRRVIVRKNMGRRGAWGHWFWGKADHARDRTPWLFLDPRKLCLIQQETGRVDMASSGSAL